MGESQTMFEIETLRLEMAPDLMRSICWFHGAPTLWLVILTSCWRDRGSHDDHPWFL